MQIHEQPIGKYASSQKASIHVKFPVICIEYVAKILMRR